MYNFKLYWRLSYLASEINGCVLIFAFAFLFSIPVGNKS